MIILFLNMQDVREKYSAHSDRGKQIQFESDKIELNIPMEGTVVNGWKIIPLKTPEVSFVMWTVI